MKSPAWRQAGTLRDAADDPGSSGAAQYFLLKVLLGPAGAYSQIQRRGSRDRVRSGMREFESSHPSQPVRHSEKPSLMVARCGAKLPEVSGRMPKYSRFRETAAGD